MGIKSPVITARSSVGEAQQWGAFTGQIDYDRFYEQYASVATHREFSQGMVITRRMYESDLTGILKRADRFRKIVRSGLITRQTHAASIFNSSTSINTTFYESTEAVPLDFDGAYDAHAWGVDGNRL